MAFCNACGETLDPAARFCKKCGAPNPSGPPVSDAQPGSAISSAPAAKSTSTAKIILIVAVVVVGMGILGIAATMFIGLGIARHTHVTNSGDKQRVETPFGTFETGKDTDEALKNLGIEVYPGAQALKSHSAATIGGMKTVSAEFESSDAAEKVFDFYKNKFPNANVTQSGQDHYTIVSTDNRNVISINIRGTGDKTHFQIASVSGKNIGNGKSDSSD